MRCITHIPIEHVVVSSERSYKAVKTSLEARMGLLGNTDDFVPQVAAAHASREQVTQAIEKRLGASGFSFFSKVEKGQMLSLAGKPKQVSQYAIGNALLAIQMIERVPEVALYDPQGGPIRNARLEFRENTKAIGRVASTRMTDATGVADVSTLLQKGGLLRMFVNDKVVSSDF